MNFTMIERQTASNATLGSDRLTESRLKVKLNYWKKGLEGEYMNIPPLTNWISHLNSTQAHVGSSPAGGANV